VVVATTTRRARMMLREEAMVLTVVFVCDCSDRWRIKRFRWVYL
jgi:hypothetical protein